jgi:hypothetical protein
MPFPDIDLPLNLFIRLLIAHFLADFVFQSKAMAFNKKWNSPYFLLHLLIVFLTTAVFTFSLSLSLLVFPVHGLIDLAKGYATIKYPERKVSLFFADQVLHILSLVFLWLVEIGMPGSIPDWLSAWIMQESFSLVFLAYLLVLWPSGYAIQYALSGIIKFKHAESDERIERGGNLIGFFERIIILTFMLLGAYEGIGFLITGKSIIRFARPEENLRSEYVLLGTMLSYAIVIGAAVNAII